MGWKWYDINSYKASTGGSNYYGILQLFGEGFYGNLRFHNGIPMLISETDVKLQTFNTTKIHAKKAVKRAIQQ